MFPQEAGSAFALCSAIATVWLKNRSNSSVVIVLLHHRRTRLLTLSIKSDLISSLIRRPPPFEKLASFSILIVISIFSPLLPELEESTFLNILRQQHSNKLGFYRQSSLTVGKFLHEEKILFVGNFNSYRRSPLRLMSAGTRGIHSFHPRDVPR